jgi:hypothetical protein
MKFLELTGYGNRVKHIISLNSISDITFEKNYTNISFINGKILNVVENETTIVAMINHLEGIIMNENIVNYRNNFIQGFN